MESKKLSASPDKVTYEQITESTKFKGLVRKKTKFIVPISAFFLIFYFLLPVLTSYSTILNAPAIGDISWVWVFAFAQFIMTWTLCMLYVRKANQFDGMADEVIEEFKLKERGDRSL
ncbi:DUF485 domain-containing protein [Bacillus thermotolerans]|uniref:DUF485 domain-containing protein n=1 Tax=Bacillus thermotolerans TaxID=1221996 RepID=UPI00058963C0|nr:DUF485 domain-containing protein [Bacillus thermotolerans]KKB44573.1 hypothetical protein QY96_02193 [Bacillus thermotolerans]